MFWTAEEVDLSTDLSLDLDPPLGAAHPPFSPMHSRNPSPLLPSPEGPSPHRPPIAGGFTAIQGGAERRLATDWEPVDAIDGESVPTDQVYSHPRRGKEVTGTARGGTVDAIAGDIVDLRGDRVCGPGADDGGFMAGDITGDHGNGACTPSSFPFPSSSSDSPLVFFAARQEHPQQIATTAASKSPSDPLSGRPVPIQVGEVRELSEIFQCEGEVSKGLLGSGEEKEHLGRSSMAASTWSTTARAPPSTSVCGHMPLVTMDKF